MSLAVWLPLNGDLHNQGLSDLTFTTTSYNSVDDNGKIGKCYKNDAPSWNRGGILSNKSIDLGINQSMFCWVNFTTLNSSASLGGGLVTQHNASTNSGMSINIRYVSSTTGYATVSTGNGSSRTYKDYYGTTLLQAGTWYHLGYTYDGATIKIYVNGNCEKTQAYANMAVPANKIGIFGWSLSNDLASYALNGKLNDVRIYDHCLSPKEVEEIAKGLVLHYKLDNNGLGQENLTANTSTSKTLTASGTNAYCTPIPVYSQTEHGAEVIHNATASDIFTVSFDYEVTGADTAFTFAPGLNKTATSYVGLTWISRSPQVPVGNSSGHFVGVGTLTADQISYGTKWLMMGIGSNNRDISIKVSNFKFEKGSVATFWSPAPSDTDYPTDYNTTIYDCSGYSNNGTIVGNLTAAAGSPRYGTATQFPGNAFIEAEPLPATTLTISAWVNFTDTSGSAYRMVLHDKNSGLAIGYYRSSIITYAGSAVGGTGSRVIANLTANTWYHIVVVKTGDTTRDTYINGEKATVTSNNWWGGDLTKFNIGCRHVSGSYSAYTTGKIVDVRAYATALTVDQIKELYNTSMSVDSNGNVYARELVEL